MNASAAAFGARAYAHEFRCDSPRYTPFIPPKKRSTCIAECGVAAIGEFLRQFVIPEHLEDLLAESQLVALVDQSSARAEHFWKRAIPVADDGRSDLQRLSGGEPETFGPVAPILVTARLDEDVASGHEPHGVLYGEDQI